MPTGSPLEEEAGTADKQRRGRRRTPRAEEAAGMLVGVQAKESSKPGDGHGRLEEKGLGRGGRTRQHDCGRRRGKQRGRSAQRAPGGYTEPRQGHVGWRRGQLLPGQAKPRGPGEPQPKWWDPRAEAQLGANGHGLGGTQTSASQRWRHQETPGTATGRAAATTEAVTSPPLAAPEPRRIVRARPPGRDRGFRDRPRLESGGGRAVPGQEQPRNDPARGPRGRRG